MANYNVPRRPKLAPTRFAAFMLLVVAQANHPHGSYGCKYAGRYQRALARLLRYGMH